MSRPDPLKWLRANGHNLAPLTGQDTKALLAAVACWELYAVSDTDGRRGAIMAAENLYANAMQETTRHLIVKVIPFALDWSDEARLRPLVTGERS